MRKLRNLSVFITFALLLCLLAGCGAPAAPVPETQPPTEPACQHQWSEADCLNGSSCALCGEVQSEPLGHSWAAATCENPEKCTRCGEIHGDALEHRFGKWLLSSDQMYRACAFCGQAETAELDYAFYLDQHIFGHWNLHSVVRNGQMLSSDNIPAAQIDSEVWFREDGSVVSRSFAEKELTTSWSFDHGEYTGMQHVLYITDPTGAAFRDSYFLCSGEQLFYVTPDDQGNTLVLAKSHGETMASVITGIWSAWVDGDLYNITLAEDRTFTADFDGEISGYWLPRAPYSAGGITQMAEITLNYNKSGKNQTISASLLNYNEKDLSADRLSLSLSVNGSYALFALNAQQALRDAMATANSALLGTWTSTEFTTYCYTFDPVEGMQESNQSPKASTDYSITFLEDGTFQANLHRELTGKWELQNINVQHNKIGLKYRIIVPGLDEGSHFQITPNGRANLNVSKTTMSPRAYESAQYTFQRLTEEDVAAQNALADAAPSLLTGEWFRTDLADSTCTFHEDGTFTAQSGTGDQQSTVTGNWYFSTLNVSEDSSYYIYDLETAFVPEDSDSTEPVTVREDSSLVLYVRGGMYELEARSSFLSGIFTNAETIALNQEAAAGIIGHWHAETASKYDPNTKQNEVVQGNFSLNVAEDGTFTSNVFQGIQGSYKYRETEGDEVYYLFSFDGGNLIDSMVRLKNGVLQFPINSHIFDFTH